MILFEIMWTLEFLFFGLFFFAVAVAVEKNNAFMTALSLVVWGLLLYFFTDSFAKIGMITFKEWIIYGLTWAVIGIAWSTFRWYKYTGYIAEKIAVKKKSFLRDNEDALSRMDNPPKDIKAGGLRWRNTLKSIINERGGKSYPLRSMEHKEAISLWMIWWPMSMSSYIIGDMLVDMMGWIIERMGGIFDRIANRASIIDSDITLSDD